MRKVVTLSLVLDERGVAVGVERTAKAVDHLGHESTQAAAATRRLSSEQQRETGIANAQSFALRHLSSILGGLAGAGALGLLVRETFQYNQELEGTQIAIAGLLNANRTYIGVQDQWAAATAESRDLLKQLQVESLKTKATVPQIGDAFATTFGAVTAAGIKATSSEILQLTTRLTQVGNAFRVPMEQMRQEINSFVTGQITEDSIIAKRLGFDNKSVKRMEAANTFIAEVMKRSEAYAKAAEAQSNTLSGKWLNTKEIITATLSRAFDQSKLGERFKATLDKVFTWFVENGDKIAQQIDRVVATVDKLIGKAREVAGEIAGWAHAHRELLENIGATAVVVGTVVGAIVLVEGAIAALTSPITIAIAGVVALAYAWMKLSELSEIKINGVSIGSWVHAEFESVKVFVLAHYLVIRGVLLQTKENIVESIQLIGAAGKVVGSVIAMVSAHVALFGRIGAEFYAVMGGIVAPSAQLLVAPFRAVVRLIATLFTTAATTVRSTGGIFASLVGLVAAVPEPIRRIITSIGSVFGKLIGFASTPVRKAAEIFGELPKLIAGPLRQLLSFVTSLPDKIVSTVPGLLAVKDATKEFIVSMRQLVDQSELRRSFSDLEKISREGSQAVTAALNSNERLASPAEVVKQYWGGAFDAIKGWLPALKKIGAEAAEAVAPSIAKTKPKSDDGKGAKAQKKLTDLLGDYAGFMNDFRLGAAAGADPFAQQLAKIEEDRQDKLARLKELQVKLKEALGIHFDRGQAKIDVAAVNAVFDIKRIDVFIDKARESGKKIAAAWGEGIKAVDEVLLSSARRVEDARINAIEDGAERERRIRETEIDRWFDDEKKKLEAAKKNGIDISEAMAGLEEARRELVIRANDEITRSQREQLVGTREWARRMAAEIGTIPQQVTRAIGESKLAIANVFGGLIDGLITHQRSLSESFEDLIGGLAQTWGRMLNDILTKTIVNGESIVSQLKGVFDKLNSLSNPMTGGGAGNLLDAGIAGAGFGSMVGSVFQKPGNYAGVGGMAGGVAGAIVGTIIPGIGTALGAVIGSAIGTAIGSMIQKGTDHIRVSILDGVARITEEKGISGTARLEVQTQIQRRTKETIKSWQSIIDLFPQTVRDYLTTIDWKPRLDLNGGVESADITDEGALQSLQDFLGNKLPKAGFDAYKTGIQLALAKVGVGTKSIEDLFKYFGTLQGKELQDAVRAYVTTLFDSIDLRDRLDAPLEEKVQIARRGANMTSLGAMDDVRGQIATLVASASHLTDIEDVVAAQRQVTDLGRQYYDMGIARLQRIDSIEAGIQTATESLIEQIDMAGMSDQEKMNHDYERMGFLRTQLLRTTDPEEIARLTQQIHQYVSSALGLAPDNKENQDHLRAILEDVAGIGSGQLQKAREEQERKDEEVLELQKSMLEQLMGINEKLDPTKPVTPPEGGDKPGPGGDDRPRPGRGARENIIPGDEIYDDLVGRLRDQVRDLLLPHAGELAPFQDDESAAFERLIAEVKKSALDPEAVGKAMAVELRRLLEGMSTTSDTPIVIDNGDLGPMIEERVTRRVVLTFQDNPDAFKSRS